jgi:hypothetical protein
MALRNLRCTSILGLLGCIVLIRMQGRILHGDRNGAWFHAQRAGVEDKDKDECASDARCGETWVWGRRGLKFTDIAAFG